MADKISNKRILFFLLFWLVVIVIFYLVSKEIYLVLGLVLAMCLSGILMLKTYLQTYKGEIVDIEKKVSRRYDDENSTPSTYVRYFAKIKQDDGTIKKVDFHNGWKVGDYVEKLRWHFTPDVKKKLKK